MRPDSLEDIIALISLYRPGPMENIPISIERKHGLQPSDYLHPRLEDILKETYGVIVYQEQAMQIAQALSGYSLGEADLLRRAMGKKKKVEMDRQRLRFTEGAAARGVEPHKASSIFDLVAKFAGYGFNKSHAAGYALIAYQTAYLKAHYPAAFLAASMSLDRANADKLAVFLKDAETIGVAVRPPHVNHSLADFSVGRDGAVVYALSAVKNVGEAAAATVADERARAGPFKDLFDFAERLDLKAVGKRALESLVRAGAFDGLCGRSEALASVEILLSYSAGMKEERASAQGGLFDFGAAPALERPRLPTVEEWTPIQRLAEERLALGFYFSGHPLDDYERELARLGVVGLAEARERAASGRIVVPMAAVVRAVRFRTSKAGRPFAFVECSERSGEFEATVFADALNAARDLFEPGALLLLTVAAETRDGEIRFVCENARRLDQAAAKASSLLRVRLASAEALPTVKRRLEAAKPASRDEEGRVVLTLQLADSGREVEIALKRPAACTPAMRGALKAIAGVEDAELV
jgi:DNA polymerase-3 subunit alpha